MRVFCYGNFSDDHAYQPLLRAGHDTVHLNGNWTAQEAYDTILEADAVLLQYAEVAEIGALLGIAIAFGKPVYVVDSSGKTVTNAFLEMEGVGVYEDLGYALEMILEAGLDEEQDDEHVELHGGGDLGPGGDSEQRDP